MATVPAVHVHESHCPLDCPDACSLEVKVADGRVVSIDGTRVNPLTNGYICAKVRRYPEQLYGSDRLLHPARRRGPKGEAAFERLSWDDALSLVAEKLSSVRREWGGEAILPFSYGGSNGYLSQDTTDARLFNRLGASRLDRAVCAAPTGAAARGLYGKMLGVAFSDYVHARLIVVWGMNPSATGIHVLPFIQQAQKSGARLVVVDPRKTPLAGRADAHLALRPGTDLPVALSIVRWLFAEGRADQAFLAAHTTGADELRGRAEPWTFARAAEVSGLSAADLEAFARLYADSAPAVIRCGWGLERNRNGGSAVASVLALPAVAGKFGVRGGGYTLSNSSAWKFDLAAVARAPEPATRLVNMNHMGEVLAGDTRPPVKLVFVYNCNPLMTMPNQERVKAGLLREDLFTVVFDEVMTDTARYADVVLPASSFLERRELHRGYGSTVLQDARPVIPPVGESRANHDVFAELCRRTGVAEAGEPEDDEALTEAILRTHPRYDAVKKALDEDKVAVPEVGSTPVQFVDVFPGTADRKVHLVPPDLDAEAAEGLYTYRPDPATERHPLALVSPATGRTVSSSLGQLHKGQVPLELHPDDARARGIADGDSVRVWNDLGTVVCRVKVTTDVRPGVVSLPKGLWSHNTLSGTTSNALCPDTLTDIAGGACFNDARVQVERAGD
jgi:anaerobic selenocysteine-containing dehydrogenase